MVGPDLGDAPVTNARIGERVERDIGRAGNAVQVGCRGREIPIAGGRIDCIRVRREATSVVLIRQWQQPTTAIPPTTAQEMGAGR